MEKYDSELYSIIDLDYLSDFINNKIDNIKPKKKYIVSMFEIETIINPCSQKNCISISLFCQNVDNKDNTKDNLQDYKNKKSKWYLKYYTKLINFISDFNKSKYYANFKIRLYLENQLDCFITELASSSSHIEIYYMKENSIGASPGALWRFLTFDDKNLDVVFCSDIDEVFNDHIPKKLDIFMNNNKTLGRYFGYYNNDIRIDKNNINSPLNYTVCVGSCICIRPKLLDINIKDIMCNYILYRINRYSASKPYEEFDDKNTEKYNKPIGDHIYGWGGYWTMYGFDEKFWKHTIFPYLVKKGQVLSWIQKNHNLSLCTNSDNPYIIDYNFVKSYNNVFCYI